MRHVGSALLLAALVMGVTACQSPPGAQSPQQPRAAERTAADRAEGGQDRSDRKPGKPGSSTSWVGDSADLGGRGFGEHLRISVRGQVDPAIGIRAADAPDTGNRRLGVDVALVNVGGRPYDASRADIWVTDAGGGRYPAVRTGTLTTGFPLEWNTLPVGEQKQGWLVFEVPQDARIVRFHCRVGKTALSWQLQFPPSR
ncbi:DUF4352 domain-containing protein [Streptomyces sp. NPDC055078]